MALSQEHIAKLLTVVEAAQECPLPSMQANAADHYERFYAWYDKVLSPALRALQDAPARADGEG